MQSRPATATATDEVAENIRSVSCAAGQVLGSATELTRQGAELSDEVSNFITGLRAA